MRRLKALLLGIALGGGLVYFGFNYHLVRAADSWLIVPRVEVALRDACVDIRSWKLDDWRKHPELTRDMLRAGHGTRIQMAVQDSLIDEAPHRLGLSSRESSNPSRQ